MADISKIILPGVTTAYDIKDTEARNNISTIETDYAKTSDVTTAIENSASSTLQQVANSYATQTTVTNETQALLDLINAQSAIINGLTADVNRLKEKFEQHSDNALLSWVEYTNNDVYLRKENTSKQIRLESNQVSVNVDGTQVASFSDKMYAENAKINNNLNINEFVLKDTGTAFILQTE